MKILIRSPLIEGVLRAAKVGTHIVVLRAEAVLSRHVAAQRRGEILWQICMMHPSLLREAEEQEARAEELEAYASFLEHHGDEMRRFAHLTQD